MKYFSGVAKLSLWAVAFLLAATTSVWAGVVELLGDEETGYYINLPLEGTDTLTVPDGVTSFKLYDNGGSENSPTYYASGSFVISAPNAPEGKVLQVTGNLMTVEKYSSRDKLYIYDGEGTQGTALLNGFYHNASIGRIISSGTTITVEFDAYSPESEQGLDLTVDFVSPEDPHSVTVVESEGGMVSVENEGDVVSGTQVTLHVTPEEGFLLKDIYVLDEGGNRLQISNDWYLTDNPTVTFTMPFSHVKVYPSFTDNLTAEGGLYVKMPVSGTTTLEVSSKVVSFNLYDDGGPDGYRTMSSDGNLVLNSNNTSENTIWQVMGSLSLSYYDDFTIYDGTISGGKRLLRSLYSTSTSVGKKLATSKTLSISYLASDRAAAGFALVVSFVDSTQSHLITINSAEGGVVTCEKQSAGWGDSISLNVSVAEGRFPQKFDIVDDVGNHLSVSGDWQMRNESTISFVMPYSDVTVTPVFTNEVSVENGFYLNLPVTGTRNLVLPAGATSFKLYDDGGSAGKRTNGANGSLVVSAPNAPDGYVFRVTGSLKTNDGYSNKDKLYIYDGFEGQSPLILDGFYSNASIGRVVSTGKTITIKFDANAPFSEAGLDLKVEILSLNEPQTVTIVESAGGTVSVGNEGDIVKDDLVSLHVSTEEGYLLKDIYVVDDDGKRVTISNDWYLSDNPTITFTMPFSNVKVYPSFTNDLTAEGGLYAYLPVSGYVTLNASAGVTSFKLYDDGGPDGKTSVNAYQHLTINSLNASENSIWQVTGSMNSYEYSDVMVIYDGEISDNKRIMEGVGGNVANIGKKFTTGKTVSFYFHTASFNTSDGFNFTVTLMDGSDPHRITIVADEGGSVTTEKETEKRGETVTLNVKPREGFLLKGIDVVDQEGNHLPVAGEWQMLSEATLTFTMPYSDVTVTPVFTDEFTAENGIYVKLPTTGTKNVVLPVGTTSFKVYDDGGSSSNYTPGADGVLIVSVPDASEETAFLLNGKIYRLTVDSISIFDGPSTESPLLFDMYSNYYFTFENIFTSGPSMAISLKSFYTYSQSGLDLTVRIVNPHQKHRVEVAPVAGGTISLSAEDVEKDSVVTINVSGEDGYYLNNISVVDDQGREIELQGKKFLQTSTTLTFVMPFSDVSVVADFTNELTASAGLHIDMQKSGRETYTIPEEILSFSVYDDGGYSDYYSNYVNDTLVLRAPEGYVFVVSGSIALPKHNSDSFDAESDAVNLYDGDVGGRKLFSVYGNSRTIDGLYSSSNILTIVMSTDDYYTGSGLDLLITLFKGKQAHQVICESVPGGTVTADKTSVDVWGNVNLNIVPESGKFLEKVTVVDANEDVVAEYQWYAGTSVSFTMPASDVTVKPSFTDDNSAFSVNVPSSGTIVAYIPEGVTTFKLYDDGGANENYTGYSDGAAVLYAPEGRVFDFVGSIDLGSYCTLNFNDGGPYGEELMGEVKGVYSNASYATTSNVLSVRLATGYNSSYSWAANAGIDFTVNVIDPSVEYGISVMEVERGVMVSSHSSATPGAVVTLTGKPSKDGSVVSGVKVTDSEGHAVVASKASDSTYTFRMPAAAVSVVPSFANPTIVSFDENGCLNNGTYFHVVSEYNSDVGSYWMISQGVVENANVGGDDFACWNDVYNKIEPSGSDSYYRENRIMLGSDLDFGGYDENSSKCVMAFRPIGNSHSYIEGQNHTIRNFCHDSSYAGFVTKDYAKLVRDLTFENAFVRGDTAGVLASSFAGTLENVTIKDSKVVGVWAGAIAGAAKVGLGNALVSGVTVESPKNCSEGLCEAYLGGAAGYMLLVGDTIQNVRIKNVNLKRGDNSYSAYMGGLVGKIVLDAELGHYVEVLNNSVMGVSFDGALAAGGLLGAMNLNPTVWIGIESAIRNTYVQVESVTASRYAGGLVGLVSEGSQSKSMSFSVARSAVLADVSVSGENSYAGGLIGFFENADALLNVELSVVENYSVGDITGAAASGLGYLIGGLNDNSKFDIETLKINYHFGTNDALAYKGIGTFSDADWKMPELGEKMSANIRNAVAGLDADGDLLLMQDFPIRGQEASYRNGVVAAEQMKTPRFAAFLNIYGRHDEPIWSFAGDENNSSLPFLAGGKYRGVSLVGISYNSLNGRLNEAKQQILDDAIAGGTYTLESISPEKSHVSMYTGYTGRLNEADVNFMQGLLGDGEFWMGEKPFDAMTVYKNTFVEYEFDKKVELNVVYHVCTGSISDNACNGTEYEIKDGMDIEGLENIGFMLKPVKTVLSNDYRAVIPPMYRQLPDSFKVLNPSLYRLRKVDDEAASIADTTSAELFNEIITAVSGVDFSDYGNTLHLVYALGEDTDFERIYFVSTAPFNVYNSGYDIMGGWGSRIGVFSLENGDYSSTNYDYQYTSEMPVSPELRIAVSELDGFVDNYTVEFGLIDFDGVPDTVSVTEDYLVSHNDFAKNYLSTVWKKENLTSDDVIRLDSIYTNLRELSLSANDFFVRITPQLREYIVKFNVYFLEGVDTSDVYFGQGWDSEKPTTKKVHLGDIIPRMYHTNKFLDIGGWLTEKVGVYEGYQWSSPEGRYFSAGLIPENIGANDSIDLYTMYGQGYYEQNYEPVSIARLNAMGKNGKMSDPDSIHGTVVLIQRVGGVDYEHRFTRIGDEYILLFPRLDVADTLDFKVVTRPDPGFTMVDLEHGAYCDFAVCPEWSDSFPFGLRVSDKDTVLRIIPDDYGASYGDMSFSVRFVPKSYTVSFDMGQADAQTLVLGNRMDDSIPAMTVGDSRDFPSVYAQNGETLTAVRWSAEPRDRSQFSSDAAWNEWVMTHTFDYFTIEIIKDAFADREDDGQITLYPIVVEGIGKTYSANSLLIKAVNEDDETLTEFEDYHGSIELTQSYGSSVFGQDAEFVWREDGYAYKLSVPGVYMDDTLTYNVVLHPDPGYKMTIVSFEDNWTDKPEGFGYDEKTQTLKYHPARMAANNGFTVNYELLNYKVVFARPTSAPPMLGGAKVDYFVSDMYEGADWVDGPNEYTIEADDRSMPELYSAQGCVGWSKTRKAEDAFYYFDEVAATTLDETDTVFATYYDDEENCHGVLSNTVTVHTDGRGSIELWQFIGKEGDVDTVRHAFTLDEEASTQTDKVYVTHIPTFDLGSERDLSMTFEVHAVSAIPGTYYLEEDSLYYFKKSDEGAVMFDIEDGDTIKSDSYDLEFYVKFGVNEVQLAFDAGEDGLFYGSDWKKKGMYKLGDSSAMQFPLVIYSDKKCLAGWAIDSTDEEPFAAISDSLLRKMSIQYNREIEGKILPLYARWTDDESRCPGGFTRLSIEQENGVVGLKDENLHEFVKGSMILPNEIPMDSLRVQSRPDSSYVLDSLVISYMHEDGNDEKCVVLLEGMRLPRNIDGALLKAYFGKANKTPIEIVEKELVQSGNAVRLSFKASDFEVTRGVSARVKLIDVMADTVVVDSLLSDSIAMAFESKVLLRVKNAGEYKMVLILEDERETAEYAQSFAIENEIATSIKGDWQMISLAAVDTSALNWGPEDQIFYWWDEYGTGEFWQYKRFVRGGDIIPTRGTWYSSLKGSSLALQTDLDDNEEDVVWELDSASSGWNLVANTHNWAVDLYANHADQDVAVDKKSDVTFWRYNPAIANYEQVKYAGPYEAVWAKVSRKITWTVSGKPVFWQDTVVADADSGKLAKASTKEQWTLRAVLSDKNGRQDAWNILGTGLDPFTAEEPPASMGDHVNLSIVEGKRSLAKSIKPHSENMEWNLAISATSERIGYLTIAGIEGVKAYGYHVYVTVDGKTTEMLDGVPLTVYLTGNAKMATVRVAPDSRAIVVNSLKGLRSARLGNKLHVSFDATGLAGTNARVDVVDLKGHVMATATAKAVEGENALVLDAPKSGLYMLRVRAGSQQQVSKILVK